MEQEKKLVFSCSILFIATCTKAYSLEPKNKRVISFIIPDPFD